MPGMRDKNLRSGDLHEELGILLLKGVALVVPVQRQEDVGIDVFATLIRPEGNRRLIPDQSFFVQLKSASVTSVRFTKPDEMTWITDLEVPLFIGRVNLKESRIELFTTLKLDQILIERGYEGIELLLDSPHESSSIPNHRIANIGPPIHAWSVADLSDETFMSRSFEVLQPHIETLRRNRLLRGIQSHRLLIWETGRPPTYNGDQIQFSIETDVSDTLRDMTPHVRRLLLEIMGHEKFGDFPLMLAFFDMMRRWGVDPDPNWSFRRMVGSYARGPELSVEDAINIRHVFQCNQSLDLKGLEVTDDHLDLIPDTVTGLCLVNTLVTDEGIPQLLKLAGLKRVNLAGTMITDDGLSSLANMRNIEWVCVNRTPVTPAGVAKINASRPDLTVIIGSEPGSYSS